MTWKSVSWGMRIASFFNWPQLHSALTRNRHIFSSTQPAPHLISANHLTTSFENKMAAVSCKLLPSHSPFPTPSRHLPLFQPQKYVSESGSPLGLDALTYTLPLITRGRLHRGTPSWLWSRACRLGT